MGAVLHEIVIDCNDPPRVAEFWRQVDVGQGDAPWVVLADPEGNEFCVLGRRADD
jgi:hypothetical protein